MRYAPDRCLFPSAPGGARRIEPPHNTHEQQEFALVASCSQVFCPDLVGSPGLAHDGHAVPGRI